MKRCCALLLLFVVLVAQLPPSLLAQQAEAKLASDDPPNCSVHDEGPPSPTEPPATEHPPDDLLAALIITGQVRHRSELDRTSRATPPSLHLLRTRLNVAFQPTTDVTAFIQVQDSRTFGGGDPAAGRGTLDGRAPALDLHQAYFTVSNLLGTDVWLKVGRQELAYGNQRLLGSVGWSNVGRTFDAGVLGYQSPRVAVDVIAARLVDDRASAQNLLGIYSTWRLGAPSLEVFALYDDNSAKIEAGPDAGHPALRRTTIGTTQRGALRAFDYDLEAAYQFGQTAQGEQARADIAAYLISAAGGVRVGQGRVGALYTILSGDDDPTDGKATTFNTLFATNHKFYGTLDLFPFNTTFQPGGLHDAALRVSYPVSEDVGLSLDLHHFRLAQDLGNGTTLGQEADLTVQIRYNKAFGILAGASVFIAADQAEASLGTHTATWFFLSTTVDF